MIVGAMAIYSEYVWGITRRKNKKDKKCEVDIRVRGRGRERRERERKLFLRKTEQKEAAGREWATGRSLGRGTFEVHLPGPDTTGTNPSPHVANSLLIFSRGGYTNILRTYCLPDLFTS
jgi:hypothetical protein